MDVICTDKDGKHSDHAQLTGQTEQASHPPPPCPIPIPTHVLCRSVWIKTKIHTGFSGQNPTAVRRTCLLKHKQLAIWQLYPTKQQQSAWQVLCNHFDCTLAIPFKCSSWQDCLLVTCLASQEFARISQGQICSDRSCISNFLSHPVTVYWCQVNQSQCFAYNTRHLAGKSMDCQFLSNGMTRPTKKNPRQKCESNLGLPLSRQHLNYEANKTAAGRKRTPVTN